MATEDYLHGFNATEQERLRVQSRILSAHVMRGVSYPDDARVLEIGCGVGAQSELLLERFPGVTLTSVDREEAQLEQARARFRAHPNRDRVEFVRGDALALPFADATFDGAFICWVLEHLKEPAQALAEVLRCLKPGAVLHANEVFNQMHYVHPRDAALLRYYDEFNRLQLELGGDPFVGVRLGSFLTQVGFTQIATELNPELWDRRDPVGRKKMTDYWKDLLMSAADGLLARGRVDQATVDAIGPALDRAGSEDDGVLFFSWVKARAVRR